MSMSLEHPLTKVWICVVCGDVYELLPDEQPPRSSASGVLCAEHASQIVSEIVI